MLKILTKKEEYTILFLLFIFPPSIMSNLSIPSDGTVACPTNRPADMVDATSAEAKVYDRLTHLLTSERNKSLANINMVLRVLLTDRSGEKRPSPFFKQIAVLLGAKESDPESWSNEAIVTHVVDNVGVEVERDLEISSNTAQDIATSYTDRALLEQKTIQHITTSTESSRLPVTPIITIPTH